jgi:hypothetical protein
MARRMSMKETSTRHRAGVFGISILAVGALMNLVAVGAHASTGTCHNSGHTSASSSRGSSETSDHPSSDHPSSDHPSSDHASSDHASSDNSATDHGRTAPDHEAGATDQRDGDAANRDSSANTPQSTTCSCSPTASQKSTNSDTATREPATEESVPTPATDGARDSGPVSQEPVPTAASPRNDGQPVMTNDVQVQAGSHAAGSVSTASEPVLQSRSATPTAASTLRSGGLAFTGRDWGAVSAFGASLIGIGLLLTGSSRRSKRGQHFRPKSSESLLS